MASTRRAGIAAIALALSFVSFARAENIDPGNDDHQYAWGENAGWFNAEPSGNGGPGIDVGDFTLMGWMWGENVGWVSLSCANTASCGTAAYGVTNNGFGVLSGFAWGENSGWINFAPSTCGGDPTCGVRVNPATGYFSGRAWGENIGWVTFSSGAPLVSTARTSWCAGFAAPPGTTFTLNAAKLGPDVMLSWGGLAGAGWYDVVQGTLSSLRSSGGDFSASAESCAGSRLTGSSQRVSGPPPASGDARWFLVRGGNCRGFGSFDSGSPRQVGSRDAEIAASPGNCP